MSIGGQRFSKRFLLVATALIIVATMGVIALFKDMEAVAVTCVTGLIGIIGFYVEKETKRPSK